jgi:hypothetical protein
VQLRGVPADRRADGPVLTRLHEHVVESVVTRDRFLQRTRVDGCREAEVGRAHRSQVFRGEFRDGQSRRQSVH